MNDALIYLQHPIEGQCPKYFWRCEVKKDGVLFEALFFTDGSCALTLECGRSFVYAGIKTRVQKSEILGENTLLIISAPNDFLTLFRVDGALRAYTYCQPREVQRFTYFGLNRHGRVSYELTAPDDPDPLLIEGDGDPFTAVLFTVLGAMGMAWAVCLLQGGLPW